MPAPRHLRSESEPEADRDVTKAANCSCAGPPPAVDPNSVPAADGG